ncbi:MAG: SHOCT domain-containing protein [Solirubrobacteraceae bacterium]
MRVGEIVNVYFRHSDHSVRIDLDDPRVSAGSDERRRQRREAEIAQYAPDASSGSPVAALAAALTRAREAGDTAEIERLRQEMKRRLLSNLQSQRLVAASRSPAPPQVAASGSESSAPVRAAARQPDPLDLIARLADLHAQGALTDVEFAAEKAKLLAEE